MTATPSQLSSPSARRHVALSLTLGSLNRNFTAHCVALVRPNSIFPALISALSDFPALFAPLTRENPHEEIEGKIELRKIPMLYAIAHLLSEFPAGLHAVASLNGIKRNFPLFLE